MIQNKISISRRHFYKLYIGITFLLVCVFQIMMQIIGLPIVYLITMMSV